MTNYYVIAEREGERGWRVVVSDVEHLTAYAARYSDIERVAISAIGRQYRHFDKVHITMRLPDSDVTDVTSRAEYLKGMLAVTGDYARREAFIVAAQFVWQLSDAGLGEGEIRDLLDISSSVYGGMLTLHTALVDLMAHQSVKDGHPVPLGGVVSAVVAEQKHGFPNPLAMNDHTTPDGTKWIYDGIHDYWRRRDVQVAPAAKRPVEVKGDSVTLSAGSGVSNLEVTELVPLDGLLAKGISLLEEIRDAVAKPKPDWEHWHDVPDLTPYRGQSMPVNGPYYVNVHTERVLFDHRTGKRTEVSDDFDAGPLVKADVGEVWWDSAKVPDGTPYWEQHGAREVFFINRGGARYVQNTREGKQSQRRSMADRASMIRRAPFVRAQVSVSY